MIIYKTTNLITNKIYVGKDAKNDPNYYGSGLLLQKSILKHGIDNFVKETLQECSTLEELNDAEIYWIAKLNSKYPVGYNIANGGLGGDVFTHHPYKEIYRNNLSKSCRGCLNGMYGKHHTVTTKLKISEHHKNSVKLLEVLKKNTELLTGKPNIKLSISKKKYYSDAQNRLKTSIAVKKYYETLTEEQYNEIKEVKRQAFKRFKNSNRYETYVNNMSNKMKSLCQDEQHILKLSTAIKIGIKENLVFNFILKNNIDVNYFIEIMKNKDNGSLLELKRKYNALNIQFSMKSFYKNFDTIDIFLEKFLNYMRKKHEN